MAPKLHGIHKRAGAARALRRLLQPPWRQQPELAPDPVQVPGHPAYWLCRRQEPKAKGRHKWIWFDIQSKKKGVRRDRVGWKKPLALQTKPNGRYPGGTRTDLAVYLWTGVRLMAFYHRLVGLSLLQCHWTLEGRLLAQPFMVQPAWWGKDDAGHFWYEVHHRYGPYNCDPRALAVVPWQLHLRISNEGFKLLEPRGGWGQ